MLGDRYVHMETIAEGNYGQVAKMKDKVTGKVVAVKTLSLHTEEGLSSYSLREISALTQRPQPAPLEMQWQGMQASKRCATARRSCSSEQCTPCSRADALQLDGVHEEGAERTFRVPEACVSSNS